MCPLQPHLKKCFEGIKKLDMNTPGDNERKQYLSLGIFSPDGERTWGLRRRGREATLLGAGLGVHITLTLLPCQ